MLNLFCRDDWIRTSDLLHPMQTRYRAALRPALKKSDIRHLTSAIQKGLQI